MITLLLYSYMVACILGLSNEGARVFVVRGIVRGEFDNSLLECRTKLLAFVSVERNNNLMLLV